MRACNRSHKETLGVCLLQLPPRACSSSHKVCVFVTALTRESVCALATALARGHCACVCNSPHKETLCVCLQQHSQGDCVCAFPHMIIFVA